MKCHIIPLPNEESHQPKQHYYKILLTKKQQQQQQETRTNVKRQQKSVTSNVLFCRSFVYWPSSAQLALTSFALCNPVKT